MVLGAADWSAKRASQRSFFSSFCPVVWGSIFGQHRRSCNDSLCARPASPPKNLLAQVKVSLRNHKHMRSIQLLRLQAYTHSEGPQPRSQKCLFLRPLKQACWKFFCAFIITCYHNTATTTAGIHTYREGPWMQGMVSCKKKPPFLGLLRSMSAQHRETYKATSSQHSVWIMIAQMAMESRLTFLALVWHGSMQRGSVREKVCK